MIGYVYKTTNKINGKVYIGQHKKTEYDPDYYGSGTYLKRALLKYGKESFTNEVIEWCEDRKSICDREKYWIKEYNSTDNELGYNITPGGEFGDITAGMTKEDYDRWIAKMSETRKGMKHTEEWKTRMSERMSGKNNPMYGKDGTNLGKRFSKEHAEKIRKANLGRKVSAETRMKISIAKKNPSEETRNKLSLAAKGRKHTDEWKSSMSKKFSGKGNPNYGKPMTQEQKDKISQSLSGENNPNYGKKRDPQSIAKMREGNKNRVYHNTCKVCGTKFEARSNRAVYCSDVCRKNKDNTEIINQVKAG